jgi:hypothetical protein
MCVGDINFIPLITVGQGITRCTPLMDIFKMISWEVLALDENKDMGSITRVV